MIDQRALDIAVRRFPLLLSAARSGQITNHLYNPWLFAVRAKYHSVVREMANNAALAEIEEWQGAVAGHTLPARVNFR